MNYQQILEHLFELEKSYNELSRPLKIPESAWNANLTQHKREHIENLRQRMDTHIDKIKSLILSDPDIDSDNKMNSMLSAEEWFRNSTFSKYEREFMSQ